MALRDDVLVAALHAGAESRQALDRLRAADGALGETAVVHAETGSAGVRRVAVSLLEARDDWLQAGGDWAARAGLDRWAILELASDLSWAARRKGRSRLEELRDVDLGALDPATPADRFLADCRLQAERFDFRFAELRATVEALGARWTGDPFVVACRAYAHLATGRTDEGLADLAVARSTGSDQPKVLHVLVHGLWFADGLAGRADLALEICHRLLVLSPGDAVVHLRRGVAHRWKGEHEQALRAFDDGIARLDPTAVDVHADFVRERALTAAALESAATQAALLDDLRAEAAREVQDVRDQLNDGVFKVVEILGLFIALASFLGTSGVALFTEGTFTQRIVVLAAAVIGSLLFFVVLRQVVQPQRQRRAARSA